MNSSFLADLHNENISGVAYKNIQLKKKILAYFALHDVATIADLSREFNISIPKINDSINELITENLVKDYGKQTSNIGRKPNNYGLEANSVFFIGVQVGNDSLNIAMINMKTDIVAHRDDITFRLENNKQSLLAICEEINDFISSHNTNLNKVLGVGINFSGRINYRTGQLQGYFDFLEIPLPTFFKQELGINTFVENDTRGLAYGEFSSGLVREEKDVLFVNVDNGVGLGIMIDGQLYYGKSGFSGEFGHIPIFDNDIICKCGKKGCLETEASGGALRHKVIQAINHGASSILTKQFAHLEDVRLIDIVRSAKMDDNLSIEAINEVGEKLGRGIAALINIFNPELIIIGGILAQSEEYLSLPLKNAINKYSLSIVNKDTKIVVSTHGEKLGAIGAGLLLRDRLLKITA